LFRRKRKILRKKNSAKDNPPDVGTDIDTSSNMDVDTDKKIKDENNNNDNDNNKNGNNNSDNNTDNNTDKNTTKKVDEIELILSEEDEEEMIKKERLQKLTQDEINYAEMQQQKLEKESEEQKNCAKFIGDFYSDLKIIDWPFPFYWGYYYTPEQVQALIAFLDERGHREKNLKENLTKILPQITEIMQNFKDQNEKANQPVTKSNTYARSYFSTVTRTTARSQRYQARQAPKEGFMGYSNKFNEESEEDDDDQ